jgi:hypothetical protein
MKIFDIRTSEIRDIPNSLYDVWIESDNPKRFFWKPLPKKPTYDPVTQKEPVFVNREWVVENKTEEEMLLDQVKEWPSSMNFFLNFTLEEQQYLVSSQDPQISLFRYLLSLKRGFIFSNDKHVSDFLSYLVSFNVITEERKSQILAK